jgi:uncharacterized PurR-regulated membrane protein YhhQ (DUF165 family)
VSVPLELFGYLLTPAAFVYPFVIIATDLTVRLSGSRLARQIIIKAYPIAIVSSIAIIYLEGNPIDVSMRIGLGSATAYGIGSLIDAVLFQRIRDKCVTWWIAPALSTVISNIIDTLIFFWVAFANSSNVYMAANWTEIATTLIVVKIVIGIFLFLPIYGYILNKLK